MARSVKQERAAFLDVQAMQVAHRMLGLALRRTEAGEIVLAQQGAGRRAHGGHVQRLEAPAGAPGPQRGTHAAAPQQIDVGARTGRNGRGNRPEPAWPIARRSTAAGRRSRRAPRTPCAGPAPCPGARPAWRRARRCRCDPRRWWAPCPARRRSWPARPPACPARSGRAAASANLARPSRRRPAPMRLWTSIRPWERQGGAVHPKAARPGRG